MQSHPATVAHWSIEDIPFDRIESSRIRHREDMLFLLAASSFIEYASDTYAGNLADYYRDEPEVAAWLSEHWEKEELQHGRALRAYVEQVWPTFPWQRAYDSFYAEYSTLCGAELYEPTHALEMVARCVVEMGTATFYRTLREIADEPVLRQLAEHIRSDEVGHYKHFLRYFDRYDAREKNSRMRVMGALKRRLMEVRQSDAEIGLWHPFVHVHPDERRDGKRFIGLQARIAGAMRPHYPAEQAIRMMLKPLRLPGVASSLVQPLVLPIAILIRSALLR